MKAVNVLAGRLHRASRLTVLTGAGVSAASGVPTFRGPGGLWKDFRPEELATREAFARDPRLVWEWYDWRRQLVSRCRPNRAHEVIAQWSRRYPVFRLITQNVDGLHERAGTQGLTRFHGSLWDVSCWNSCRGAPPRWRDETVPFAELPPRCPHCGGWVRPGVVWFGEPIDAEVLRDSADALDCDVCLVVGTSSVVYPAAGLAGEARRRGSFVAVLNPDADAGAEDADLVLAGRAEEVLDELEMALTREWR
ncbi:MAG: NAD-dependent deacylase [Thermoanaerobaculia bacterium]|nr:NAD-dependent deacylase [Thermoanaerobaculia bacterium]